MFLHMCHMGLSKFQENLNLGMAGNIFSLTPCLLVLAMVIWASTGRSCRLQYILIPSQFSGQYVMPDSSVDPPSAFSPDQNLSEVFLFVGWFFVFCYHFFPPSGLTLISWGKQGGEPTDKIPSLRCVCCFFVADHNDNILHLFAILQFQNCFCVWASLILRLQGGVDLWVGTGPGGNGAEQEWVTEPSFPYSFFHF